MRFEDGGDDGEGGSCGGGWDGRKGEGGTQEAAGLRVEADYGLHSGVGREIAGPGGDGKISEDGEACQDDSYQWIIAGWYDF